MNPDLLRIVERRLDTGDAGGARWAAIVLAACEGQAALESFTPRMQTRIRDQYRLGAPASGGADRIDG